MKILTVVGTRPEIIRLSVLIKRLDQLFGKNHLLVNTGQNFKSCLNDVFWKDFSLRDPDYHLNMNEPKHFAQVGTLIQKLGDLFESVNPDYLVILGDTNTAFAAAYVARHFRKNNPAGVPIFHMEAGNRSYDDRVPEEVNRSVVDVISTVNMCYTQRQKENLVHEGITDHVYVTGNPQAEILKVYQKPIEDSTILEQMNLNRNGYILATLHRAENVGYAERIQAVLQALKELSQTHKKTIVISCHPRMQERMEHFGFSPDYSGAIFMEPVKFSDLVKLQKNAFLVTSDSGTIPEECTIQNIPNIILRDSTERIEIIECGGSLLSGTTNKDAIVQAATLAIESKGRWQAPADYLIEDFSHRAISIITQFINGSRMSRGFTAFGK